MMDSISLFKVNVRGRLQEELLMLEKKRSYAINYTHGDDNYKFYFAVDHITGLARISGYEEGALKSAFLKHIDKVNGLTYQDKAAEIGISLSTLKNLMRNTYPTCKFDTVVKFSFACCLTIEETAELLSFAGLAFSIANFRHVCIKQLLVDNYLAIEGDLHDRLSHEEINDMLQAVGCEVLY